MNLNRKQFLEAVERGSTLLEVLKKEYPELRLKPVFSRNGVHIGQFLMTTDLRTIVMTFPELLDGDVRIDGEKAQKYIKQLHGLLFRKMKEEAVDGDIRAVEQKLLTPDLRLYCGDIRIEFRPDNLNCKSLQRFQQDSRVSGELNEIENVRFVAGSLDLLGTKNNKGT